MTSAAARSGPMKCCSADCTWATIPAPPAVDDIPNTALRTGTDSGELIGVGSGNHQMDITINDFAFTSFAFNNTGAGTSTTNGIGISVADYNAQTTPYLTASVGINGPNRVKFIWKFIAASDHPGIWVVLSADGTILGIYESEDYEKAESPLGLIQTTDDNGVTTTPAGQQQLNLGPPTLTVIQAVYGGLTASQRTAALSCTGDYVTGRGWLDAFSTLSDLSGIETRYEPSGRQWAMRCAAQASDEAVTGFYLGALVVSSGAWAVAQ